MKQHEQKEMVSVLQVLHTHRDGEDDSHSSQRDTQVVVASVDAAAPVMSAIRATAERQQFQAQLQNITTIS